MMLASVLLFLFVIGPAVISLVLYHFGYMDTATAVLFILMTAVMAAVLYLTPLGRTDVLPQMVQDFDWLVHAAEDLPSSGLFSGDVGDSGNTGTLTVDLGLLTVGASAAVGLLLGDDRR